MAQWLASSRRFAAFALTYKDKIRKKLRTTQDPSRALDLQLELETAYLLLQERTLSLAYEPEQFKGIRSPDFGVTFTTRLTFMLEVTRVQSGPKRAAEPREQPPEPLIHGLPGYPAGLGQLAEAVLGKLGQLLPHCPNVLLVAIETPALPSSDLRNAMLSLQQRAERSDPSLLEGQGYRDRADFFREYQRLSEVLVRVPDGDQVHSVAVWINPQARYPLPGRVQTVLHRALAS